MSGDGTSCGSRRKPTSRKTTSAMNSTSGMNKSRFISLYRRGRCCRSSGRSDATRFIGSNFRTLLCRNCVPSISNGEATTDRHQKRAQPNPIHQRFVIYANSPRATTNLIAQCKIQITKQTAVNRRFRRYTLRGREGSFFRMHQSHKPAAPGHFNVRAHGLVIRPRKPLEVRQSKIISPDIDGVADVHFHISLSLVARDHGNAGNEHGHAHMREVHSVIAPAWRRQLLYKTQLARRILDAAEKVLENGDDDPNRK